MSFEKVQPAEYKKKRTVVAPSFILEDGTVGEMIYDGKTSRFTVSLVGERRPEPVEGMKYLDRVVLPSGETLYPYSPRNNLIRNRIVLLPSETADYGSERELLSTIQSFLHRYVDMSPLFERLAAYYVLFSWLFDDFNELPYLRRPRRRGERQDAVSPHCRLPLLQAYLRQRRVHRLADLPPLGRVPGGTPH